MREKSILTIILFLAIILSVLPATKLVDSASANFYVPPPEILSPLNATYTVNEIPLTVKIRHPAFFPQDNITVNDVFFSLDGKANASISVTSESGNDVDLVTYWAKATLSGLSDGNHTIVAYATGNTQKEPYIVASASFYVDTVNVPFPTTSIAAALASILVVSAVLLFYFVKVKKKTQPALES